MDSNRLDNTPGRREQVGLVIPHTPTRAQRALARLVVLLESLLTATLQIRWTGSAGLLPAEPDRPAIFCLWHNRLALCMLVHRKRARKLAAMVSASKDGALLAAVLQRFGVVPVRGSSSRRGRQALLELTGYAQSGYDLAITPDGPRGPRYLVQEGVVALAQVTGLPIVPVTWHSPWKILLKSWDRFHVPLPFAPCQIVLKEPILVPRGASETERESLRVELQRRLEASPTD